MSRLEWILGIFLVALLLVVAVLSFMFWTQPRSPQVASDDREAIAATRAAQIAPTSIFVGKTAKAAYDTAVSRAEQWSADATLMSATATWPQGADAQALLEGETTWAFTFYSPNLEAIARISVIEDKANLIGERPYQPENRPGGAGSWELDSNTAIQYFLSEGGQDFIDEEDITMMTMLLSTDTENGRPQWFISLLATQTNHTLSMNVDAASGEILDIERFQ